MTNSAQRFEPDPEQEQRLAQHFLETVLNGDIDGLLEILADDIVVYSGGGGKVIAAEKPVVGVELVSRFLMGLPKLAPARPRKG